jgi:cell division protein FtsI (penicillin-binding protein 3)
VRFEDSAIHGDWANVFADNYQPLIKSTGISQKLMPNVKGMGLKDALYLLETMGMKVSVKGRGKVFSQSLAPAAS